MIKLTFLHLAIWQNWCFGLFYYKRIDVLKNCSAFFDSVSLASENPRGLSLQKNSGKNIPKLIFQTLIASLNQISKFASSMFQFVNSQPKGH